MTRDPASVGSERHEDRQANAPLAMEVDVARDGLTGGHWHTIETLGDCPDHCMPAAWVKELEDNILRNHDANLRTWRAGHANCEGCAIRRRRARAAERTGNAED